ncbi:serine carboxypeptidase-domain-containing protein, partial [Mycena rosella]
LATFLPVVGRPVTSLADTGQTLISSAGIDAAQAFTPVGTLNILSEAFFTVLAHSEFPQYGVRIKKSHFCDETVRYAMTATAQYTFSLYTGYIDIQAHHLLFYFFESRSNPDKDNIIFWTNGGPGCSSWVGLLMELG